MALRTCGTVVRREEDRVIVRIEQERCVNCIGCIRLSFPKDVSAIGDHAVGERVSVQTSTLQLSLASLVVFGLPIVTVSLAMWVWNSIWSVAIVFPLSLFGVYLCMCYTRLRKFLKVYAESI